MTHLLFIVNAELFERVDSNENMSCHCVAAALVLGVPHPNVVQQSGLVQLAELSVVSHTVLICVVCQVHGVILGLNYLATGQLHMHNTFVSLDAVDLAALKGRVMARPHPHLRGTLHSERCGDHF